MQIYQKWREYRNVCRSLTTVNRELGKKRGTSQDHDVSPVMRVLS
jgi:hypothetical protein